MKSISIICPVYNEETSILPFYNRLNAVIDPLRSKYDIELIFTNNRSEDKTLSEIQKIREFDKNVHVLTYSRNFGYQASVLGGLTMAASDGMIVIDVDCEDPPEMIPEFLNKWEEGYDIVYGLRMNRPEWKGLVYLRKLFYKVLKFTADADIILNMAEFSLVSSHVRDVMIKNNTTYPFLRSEIGYVGFSHHGIPYDRQTRINGKTHYNYWTMLIFGIGGILSSSTFPMRVAVYFLPFFILLNMIMLGLDLFLTIPGLFKFLVVFDFIYGISLLTTYGIYLARIYKNSISRPVFIVDWKHSFPDQLYFNKKRLKQE